MTRSSKGFTLLEIMVALTLAMLLTGGVIAGYTQFTNNQKIKQTANTLKNNLRFVQSKARIGEKPPVVTCASLLGYRVTFTATSYSYVIECSPGASGATATEIELPASVTFSPVPDPLLFRVLDHGVDIDSTLIITLISGSLEAEVEIDPKGEIKG